MNVTLRGNGCAALALLAVLAGASAASAAAKRPRW
jgi:hypothetical protein